VIILANKDVLFCSVRESRHWSSKIRYSTVYS